MQVTLNLNIVDDDGSSFYKSDNAWTGVDRAGVLMMEKMLVKFMDDLTKVGEQMANDKSKK